MAISSMAAAAKGCSAAQRQSALHAGLLEAVATLQAGTALQGAAVLPWEQGKFAAEVACLLQSL